MTVTLLLLLCAVIISAAAGVAPSFVTAQQQQEEEDTSLGEEEELADDVISEVLDWGSSDNDDNEDENDDSAAAGDDDTNTQVAISITDQDQGAANLALNEALDVTVEPRPTPPTTQEPECSLEIAADKEIYGPGDLVVITITNTGDEPLEFPDSLLGLEIKNVDTGEVFPLNAAQVITTLEPGESRTFEFTYDRLVSEIGTGLISATVVSECSGTAEEVTFRLSVAPPDEDTTPPTLTVPEDRVVEATSADGAVVTFEVTAQDNVDGTATLEEDGTTVTQDDVGGDITIVCEPPSGSMFPLGTTEVQCTATDEAGNTATASFAVTVTPVEFSKEIGKIAFTSDRASNPWDPNFEIYVMNADGSGQTRLTNNQDNDSRPDWGPAADTTE